MFYGRVQNCPWRTSLNTRTAGCGQEVLTVVWIRENNHVNSPHTMWCMKFLSEVHSIFFPPHFGYFKTSPNWTCRSYVMVTGSHKAGRIKLEDDQVLLLLLLAFLCFFFHYLGTTTTYLMYFRNCSVISCLCPFSESEKIINLKKATTAHSTPFSVTLSMHPNNGEVSWRPVCQIPYNSYS